MDEKKLIHARRHVSQTQFIAYGFFCVIITGTLLLMLPFASRDGQSEPFLNCLFTATSASCVTGLVVADTWSQWSLFGQLVILTMIQIGGLGFITVGVFISIILRRKIGLKERGLMMESVNTLQIGGVVRLAKKIIIGTCIFEGTGAVLLAIRFIPQFGFLRGLFYGIFHSISAFCNAGFDLMGGQAPYSSFVAYYDDWLVNLVIMSLIVIGGIGFIVWDDLSRNKLHFRKYMLQTKIVLVTTAILVFGGGLLFYLMERNNLLVGMNTSGKILTSLFSSVTARTAGFNTTDTAALTDGSKLLTTILTINLLLALTASLAIMAIQPLGFSDILFETFSAIGTVGMTTGITRALHPVSRLIIILLMYCGRIGSLSFALAFVQSKRKPHVQQPAEAINIG